MDPAELERLATRALGELPTPPAPRTLLPRVMAAVAMRVRPWYARPWLMWPRGWQVVSALVFVSAAASLVVLLPDVAAATGSWTSLDLQMPGWVVEASRRLSTTLEVGRVLSQTFVDLVAGYLAAFVLTMFAAGVVFTAALNRVVLEGTWES